MSYQYQEPDKGFWINEDPDMTPFWIDLPKLIEKNYRFWNKQAPKELPILNPPPEKIAGYGLHPKDQYFRRRDMPKALKALIRDLMRRLDDDKDEDRNLEDEIWSILATNKEEYRNEIEYIKEELYFCYYGYWCYIHGKPTWIPPNHYFYLTYWEGEYEAINKETYEKYQSKYPEYRDVDRRSEAASIYFHTTTETFAKFDDRGVAIKEEDGTYKMVDIGKRTFFGENDPKNRRGGHTSRALARGYFITVTVPKAYSSIIANDKDTAYDHWEKKLVPAWQGMPFFFRPAHQESTEPKTKIRFRPPGIKGKKKNMKRPSSIPALGSVIDYAPKVDRIFYDGKKITGYLLADEGGKTKETNVYTGWSIVKQSMSTGGGGTINRWCYCRNPSTVEEMESGGGMNYKLLCDGSDIYRRDPVNGQTMTGLATIFFSAYDGLEGYVGKYGESVIDDPTPEQAEYLGTTIGSRKAIDMKIEQLEKSPKLEDMIELPSFKRKYPRAYMDCWRLMGGDLGWNIEKMNTRTNELSMLIARGEDPRRRGNFLWVHNGVEYTAQEYLEANLHVNEDPSNYVIWKPSKDGNFFCSYSINPANTNRKSYNYNMLCWQPESIETQFIMTADPVGYQSKNNAQLRADKSKASYAAGAMFYKFDPDVDKDKDVKDWVSHRFVLSYMNKPQNSHWYEEEMLMACICMGAEMFPETNIDAIIDWFEERGYAGYLKYAWLASKGGYKESPGYQAGTGKGSKDNIFTEIGNYIEGHILRENHYEIIEQFASIKAVEEMKKYDLVAATGGCLLGVKLSPKRFSSQPAKTDPKKINLRDWY